jgi:flagellar basal-body rod protein FlgG
MSSGLYYAVCGFRCQESRMEILSNNLANASTSGFKEDRPSFEGVHPGTMSAMTIETSEDQRRFVLHQKMNMSYPSLSEVKVDFSTGEMRYSGNQLDVTIRGQGFFVVDTPQGELYTRMGNFALNDKDELITKEGYTLKREGKEKEQEKPIKIEGTDITIDKDGTIHVDGNETGRLRVVDFKEYENLSKIGENLYAYHGDEDAIQAAERYEVNQYYRELPNVKVISEMVKIIDIARICETYQKVIQSLDEIDARATREVGAVV